MPGGKNSAEYRQKERIALANSYMIPSGAHELTAVKDSMRIAMIDLNMMLSSEEPMDRKELRENLITLLFGEIVLAERERRGVFVAPSETKLIGLTSSEIEQKCISNTHLGKIVDNMLADLEKEDFKKSLTDFLVDGKLKEYAHKQVDHIMEKEAEAAKAHAKQKALEAKAAKGTELNDVMIQEEAETKKDMRELEQLLKDADKNVSFGSKVYDDAAKELHKILKSYSLYDSFADPQAAFNKFQNLEAAADAYLNTKKNPRTGQYKDDLSDKTWNRIRAMQQVKEFAHDQLLELRHIDSAMDNLRKDRAVFASDQTTITEALEAEGKVFLENIDFHKTLRQTADALAAADKGVTFGTKPYTDVMEAVESFAKNWMSVKEDAYPAQTLEQMRSITKLCQIYLEGKGNPGNLTGVAKNRYSVVQDAMFMIGERADKIYAKHPELEAKEATKVIRVSDVNIDKVVK